MALPANTLTTYSAVGDREDLEDTIYKIAASKTPFTSNIGKTKVSSAYHEWQTRTLRTPNGENAALQGDDAAATAPKTTTRVGNRTQIFTEVGSVSGTQEAVDKAGRDSEMAMQKLDKGEEVATDIEAAFLGNRPSVAGSAGVAPKTAGAPAWLVTNASRGTGGASGGFSSGAVAAAVNGAQRPFTEALLKAVLATAFGNGAAPGTAYMGAAHKQTFSTFTGIAQNRTETGGKLATITGGADVYVSDFGRITTVPVQYGLTRDVLLVDHDYWAKGTLRPMKSITLAKTGDSERFEMVTEVTLVCKNERGSAIIADLS
jgi:hypothetical protein